MLKNQRTLILSLGLIFCSTISSAQGRLIAVDSNRSLYEIDKATGAKTLIGTVTSNAGTTGSLAYDPTSGTLYLSSTSLDSLFTLNLNTAEATLVGGYGTDVVMHGLEWDSSTNTLYGASSTPNSLFTINTATGVASSVGSIGLSSFNNLAYNSDTDVMYMTNSSLDSFYSINRATGTPTLIGALSGPTNPNGLAYDKDTGLLYAVDNSTDSLYTINMATGVASLIGSTGTGNLLGLAYVTDPVPEPATLAALGLGLAAVSRRRRKA